MTNFFQFHLNCLLWDLRYLFWIFFGITSLGYDQGIKFMNYALQ
jgi:hypothetical protein